MAPASRLALLLVVGTATITMAAEPGGRSGDKPDLMFNKNQQEYEGMVSHRMISDGEIWGIAIGATKQEAIHQLQLAHIEFVMPSGLEQAIVTKPSELHKLADAEGIIWFPGDARIRFSGDRVIDRQILTTDKRWSEALHSATTRSEVFLVLADILRSKSGAEFGNYAVDARWVFLAQIPDEDRQLLMKHDLWSLSRGDPSTGFWHLRLRFSNDHLSSMEMIHSPDEPL